jgi:hypothetical protein
VTTLSVNSELYEQASRAAAAQGKTVDEFVDEALRNALSGARVRHTMRNGVPVMVVDDGTPPIDPAKIRRCLEEEGF